MDTKPLLLQRGNESVGIKTIFPGMIHAPSQQRMGGELRIILAAEGPALYSYPANRNHRDVIRQVAAAEMIEDTIDDGLHQIPARLIHMRDCP